MEIIIICWLLYDVRVAVVHFSLRPQFNNAGTVLFITKVECLILRWKPPPPPVLLNFDIT